MKAQHVTVTVKVICPDGHLPEGLTLPDLAYRVATGLLAIESLTYRARPATREEMERRAAFLEDWQKSLAEFEAAMDAGFDALPGIRTAGNIGREMTTEPETTKENQTNERD